MHSESIPVIFKLIRQKHNLKQAEFAYLFKRHTRYNFKNREWFNGM